MPDDWFTLNSQVAGHYAAKAATIEGYRPARAIEIGTRCGYSLAAFSVASPRTRWLCIDGGMDADSQQCLQHWHSVVGQCRIEAALIVCNSHAIQRLPPADFAHVDGDHSMLGCYADLCLVAHVPVILADDYDNAEVAQAVDRFCGEHDREFAVYDDGLRKGAVIT